GLIVFAAESTIHSVHHTHDPRGAAQCRVLSVAQHVHGDAPVIEATVDAPADAGFLPVTRADALRIDPALRPDPARPPPARPVYPVRPAFVVPRHARGTRFDRQHQPAARVVPPPRAWRARRRMRSGRVSLAVAVLLAAPRLAFAHAIPVATVPEANAVVGE